MLVLLVFCVISRPVLLSFFGVLVGCHLAVPLFDLIFGTPTLQLSPITSFVFHVIFNSCSLVVLCEVQGSRIQAVERGV